jgi:hypothetical protein
MRIIPPSEQNKGGSSSRKRRVPVRTLQERMARQAAIERSMARYLRLVCGHYSTLEVDLFYSDARPKKGMTWCENCHKWVEIKQPPTGDTTPDQPMFLGDPWPLNRQHRGVRHSALQQHVSERPGRQADRIGASCHRPLWRVPGRLRSNTPEMSSRERWHTLRKDHQRPGS